MKRISLIAVIVLFASIAGLAQGGIATSSQQDAKRSFNIRSHRIDNYIERLSEQEGVTSIAVTKSLLDMIPEVHSYTEENGLNIKKIIAKLEHINILVSKDSTSKGTMKFYIKELASGPFSLETLMKIKTEQENVTFLGEKSTDGDFKSFIMFAEGKEQCAFIRIKGSFNKSEISEIIKMKRESKKDSTNQDK